MRATPPATIGPVVFDPVRGSSRALAGRAAKSPIGASVVVGASVVGGSSVVGSRVVGTTVVGVTVVGVTTVVLVVVGASVVEVVVVEGAVVLVLVVVVGGSAQTQRPCLSVSPSSGGVSSLPSWSNEHQRPEGTSPLDSPSQSTLPFEHGGLYVDGVSAKQALVDACPLKALVEQQRLPLSSPHLAAGVQVEHVHQP
jgi:hypothetical protein